MCVAVKQEKSQWEKKKKKKRRRKKKELNVAKPCCLTKAANSSLEAPLNENSETMKKTRVWKTYFQRDFLHSCACKQGLWKFFFFFFFFLLSFSHSLFVQIDCGCKSEQHNTYVDETNKQKKPKREKKPSWATAPSESVDASFAWPVDHQLFISVPTLQKSFLSKSESHRIESIFNFLFLHVVWSCFCTRGSLLQWFHSFFCFFLPSIVFLSTTSLSIQKILTLLFIEDRYIMEEEENDKEKTKKRKENEKAVSRDCFCQFERFPEVFFRCSNKGVIFGALLCFWKSTKIFFSF